MYGYGLLHFVYSEVKELDDEDDGVKFGERIQVQGSVPRDQLFSNLVSVIFTQYAVRGREI
jgi:hypothetical protein